MIYKGYGNAKNDFEMSVCGDNSFTEENHMRYETSIVKSMLTLFGSVFHISGFLKY